MFSQILLYSGLFVAGIVAGLTVIAPLTATKVDDKALDVALMVKKVLEALGVTVPSAEIDKAVATEVAARKN